MDLLDNIADRRLILSLTLLLRIVSGLLGLIGSCNLTTYFSFFIQIALNLQWCQIWILRMIIMNQAKKKNHLKPFA